MGFMFSTLSILPEHQVWASYVSKTQKKIDQLGEVRFWQFKKKSLLKRYQEDLEILKRTIDEFEASKLAQLDFK